MKTTDLTPDQAEVMKEVPESYRGVFMRAFTGKSRQAAVKSFCLRCVGYLRVDVRDCTAMKCPLHQYRPYQSDDEPVEVDEAGKPI